VPAHEGALLKRLSREARRRTAPLPLRIRDRRPLRISEAALHIRARPAARLLARNRPAPRHPPDGAFAERVALHQRDPLLARKTIR